MNIVMFTNTYTPFVGGVTHSVQAFAAAYRTLGHRVLVVAPEFDGRPRDEEDVLRIPSLRRFHGGDFSAVLPVAGLLRRPLQAFRPDIVHAHHPYLLGMTALRAARFRGLPLVFTHHTLYEQYTHYVPADSGVLKRFVIWLATGYANACDQVFAPSESIAALLRSRGVTTPIDVVPTGVDLARFDGADGARFRAAAGIPAEAFVVGHIGRLAAEKNLRFLADALITFMRVEPCARVVIAGRGPLEAELRERFARAGMAGRLHVEGILDGSRLADAYAAMDVFAFASRSETQGLVLTEAMAAGVPVVALDAAGAREVVEDGRNGRLLHDASVPAFTEALRWIAASAPARRSTLRSAARETAEAFSMPREAAAALARYQGLRAAMPPAAGAGERSLAPCVRLARAQWRIVKGYIRAGAFAAKPGPPAGEPA